MSNKKLFTLIYGDTIHQAPEGKIVDKEALSKICSAQEVLEDIQKEAEKYRQAVIAECEALKEQAQKEGFQEGYQEWTVHLSKMEEEIAKVRKEMQKMIIPISLKAAKKIVSSELAIQPNAVLEIVSNALKSVSQHKRIIIYVNKSDLELLEKNKNKIKDIFESLESLSLRERDDVEQGGCIIETEGGIINAQIKDRWRNLESAFESIAETLKGG